MLDVEIDSQTGTEENDDGEGSVDPDLGAFAYAKGGEIVREEVRVGLIFLWRAIW